MWRRVNTLTGKAAARFSIVAQEFASLIACVDGLRGFPEAIEAVYPRTGAALHRDATSSPASFACERLRTAAAGLDLPAVNRIWSKAPRLCLNVEA